MAIWYILKNSLMKIADVIVVRFIALAKNLVTDGFFPRCPIHSLVKDEFDRVNDVPIKPPEVK